MRIPRISALILATATLLVLSGCAATPEQNVDSTADAGTRVAVTDGTGARVSPARPVRRAVALDPSAIEMLKDLGVHHIAYDSSEKLFVRRLFGRTHGDGLTVLKGTWSKPDIESIIAFRPDLVIGDAYPHAQLKPALKGVAPIYLITRSGGYRQALSDFENIGALTGHRTVAERAVAGFCTDLRAAETATDHHHLTSLIIWGQSAQDFEVPTVEDPSAAILASISRYPWGGHGAQGMSLSLEDILKVDPDVIFVESLDRLSDPNAPSLSSQLSADPVWRQLTAVKTHRVIDVDPEIWHDDRGGLGLKKILDQALPHLSAPAPR